jgi:hypothetical protein
MDPLNTSRRKKKTMPNIIILLNYNYVNKPFLTSKLKARYKSSHGLLTMERCISSSFSTNL